MPQTFVLPRQLALDDDANPLAGAFLYFFQTGTTTPQNVYSDAALTTAHSHPVVADSSGEWPKIYLSPSATANYRVRITTADGVQLYQEDDIDRFTVSQEEITQATNPRTDVEIAENITPTNYAIPSHKSVGYVMPARYGLVNDNGEADQTTILNNSYAVAAAVRCALMLPPWKVRFTTKLMWDGSVSVIGENYERTVLQKDGNFDGIEIDGAAAQCAFRNFAIDSTSASDTTGRGIVVTGSHITIDRVSITNHGGHGLSLEGSTATGFFCKYSNIISTGNGGHGVHVSGNQFAAYFENIDARGNTGWGFNVSNPSAYHSGKAIVCQQNTAGGAQIGGQQCVLEIYGEANTGPDISLTVASVRNLITNYHIDTYPDDLQDAGTNNQIFSIAGIGAIMSPIITRLPPTTNVAGHDLLIIAGPGGAGASPVAGGKLTVQGGDAVGPGNSPGGPLHLNGGDPVGTSGRGLVAIQDTTTGQVCLGSSSPTTANSKLCISSTTKFFQPPRMTTAQRTAISLVSGDAGGMVYDSDLDKLYVVNNALSWVAQT